MQNVNRDKVREENSLRQNPAIDSNDDNNVPATNNLPLFIRNKSFLFLDATFSPGYEIDDKDSTNLKLKR